MNRERHEPRDLNQVLLRDDMRFHRSVDVDPSRADGLLEDGVEGGGADLPAGNDRIGASHDRNTEGKDRGQHKASHTGSLAPNWVAGGALKRCAAGPFRQAAALRAPLVAPRIPMSPT